MFRDLFAPVPDELLGYLPRHRYLLIEVQSLGVSEMPSEEEGTEMTTLIERARKWGEERDQQWLEKGLEKELKKGIRRGRLEGKRELVLGIAARRFGPEAVADLAPVLAGIPDSDGVAAIAARVFECETVDELVDWARRSLPEAAR